MTRARDLAAFVSNADGDIKFDTDTLFIDSSANRVGIGTTTPDDEIDVEGADPAIRLTDTSASGYARVFANNGSLLLQSDEGGSVNNSIIGFDVDGTERMRIDSNGNVGIGGAASAFGSGVATLQLKGFASGKSAATVFRDNGGTDIASIFVQNDTTYGLSIGTLGATGDFVRFHTGALGSERMRIKSDGVLVVGDTGDIRASSQTGCSVEPQGRIYMSRGTGTGGFSHLAFYNGNGLVGTVQTSGSATSYNTSSDYRLKENVTDISDGITRIKQLAPKRFNFIADADTTVDGFLAHEAATVVPEAVTGTKDAMTDEEYTVTAAKGDVYTPATGDADEVVHSSNVEEPETLENGQQWREKTAAVMGTRSVPDYQGIDQSKLVPLLTAALQEAIAKIETLETKVAALEAE